MTTFRFAHRWVTPGAVVDVRAVLADVGRYPLWWPQVRAVGYLSATSGIAVCRSLAPFDLELVLTAERQDAGVLRVGLAGDLVGWCEFQVAACGGATAVGFTQEVVVARRGLARAARVLGPALRANHAWMMRGCRTGLARQVGTSPRATRAIPPGTSLRSGASAPDEALRRVGEHGGDVGQDA